MFKAVSFLVLSFITFQSNAVVNTVQSKQEVIDYCTKTYMQYGYSQVLWCVKQELNAQKELQDLMKG